MSASLGGSMSRVDLNRWMNRLAQPDRVWYAKRLSGNDTLANGSHQAGPYVPRDLLFTLFPSLDRPHSVNPDVEFDVFVDSHADHRRVRAVWYNNALRGGTRNEARLTRFGGGSSPLLDPESTGALAILAFKQAADADSPDCRIWVCADPEEEALAEDFFGVVEPAQAVVWSPRRGRMSDGERLRRIAGFMPTTFPWLDQFLPERQGGIGEGGAVMADR